VTKKLKLPLIGNTLDNFHCFQAALATILAYYLPDRSYDWKTLDRITAHSANYTWPSAGLLYCASIGFEVLLIEDFDYGRFSLEGYSYLVEVAGKEVADDQRANSDLPQEMRYAKELNSAIRIEQRIPSSRDLRDCLESGAPVICNVNSCTLSGRKGYTGHFVVVTGVGEDGLWLHDPGLPPLEDEFVQWELFDRAWSYPDAKARNIIAFRRAIA